MVASASVVNQKLSFAKQVLGVATPAQETPFATLLISHLISVFTCYLLEIKENARAQRYEGADALPVTLAGFIELARAPQNSEVSLSAKDSYLPPDIQELQTLLDNQSSWLCNLIIAYIALQSGASVPTPPTSQAGHLIATDNRQSSSNQQRFIVRERHSGEEITEFEINNKLPSDHIAQMIEQLQCPTNSIVELNMTIVGYVLQQLEEIITKQRQNNTEF